MEKPDAQGGARLSRDPSLGVSGVRGVGCGLGGDLFVDGVVLEIVIIVVIVTVIAEQQCSNRRSSFSR